MPEAGTKLKPEIEALMVAIDCRRSTATCTRSVGRAHRHAHCMGELNIGG